MDSVKKRILKITLTVTGMMEKVKSNPTREVGARSPVEGWNRTDWVVGALGTPRRGPDETVVAGSSPDIVCGACALTVSGF
jgi:hypothetical protein